MFLITLSGFMDSGENIRINVRSIEDRNESFELDRSDNILKLRQLASERFREACILPIIFRDRNQLHCTSFSWKTISG